MAWTDITNALVAVGAKPFASTIQALRDNPIAIAEGDAAAPKIYGLAAATIDEVPVLTVSAADTYQIGSPFTVGTTIATSSGYVLARTIVVEGVTGTVRFKASHRSDTVGLDSDLKIEKNSTLVAEWTTDSTSAVERTADVAVVPGDTIQWYHNGESTGESIFSDPVETATDGYTFASLFIPHTEV